MKNQTIPQTAADRIEAEWRQMRESSAQVKPPVTTPR